MYVPPRDGAASPDSLLGELRAESGTEAEGRASPNAIGSVRLVLTAPSPAGGSLWSSSTGAAAGGTPLLGSRGLSLDPRAGGATLRRPATELSPGRRHHPAGGVSFPDFVHDRAGAPAGLVGTSPSPRGGATSLPDGSRNPPRASASGRGESARSDRFEPGALPAAAALARASSGALAGPAPPRHPSFAGPPAGRLVSAGSGGSLAGAPLQPPPQLPARQQPLSSREPSPASRRGQPLGPVSEDASRAGLPRRTSDGGGNGFGDAPAAPRGRPPGRAAFRVLDAAQVPGMPSRPFGTFVPRKVAQRRPPPPDPGLREPPPCVLDGFLLMELAGVALPELATVASATNLHLTAVEAADMEYFPALAALDLSDNALDSAAGLLSLADLRELQLSCNRLRSLGLPLPPPPGAFAALRVLDCSFNLLPPEELLPLSRLPSLAWLDCASCAVDLILPEVALGFRSLEVLSLGAQRPPLRDAALEPLSQLPRLRVLHAPHNALAAVPSLPPDAFPALQLLDLRSNRLRDAAALAPLGGCPLLREVLLHGNPLAQRRDLPSGGGVLALAEGGQVTLAAPEQARRRRRPADPFRIEAPLPTVAQALAASGRLETAAARLEAIAASGGALLRTARVAGRSTLDSGGTGDEGDGAFGGGGEGQQAGGFLPRDGFAEGLEAAFAEALGMGGGGAGGEEAGGDWPHEGAPPPGGPSVFLTEVDEGGPAPSEDPRRPPPPPPGALTHEEMVRELGPRQRIGGVGGGGDPSQAFQALKFALDHPLTGRLAAGGGGQPPHYQATTAAMVARNRSSAPAPVHRTRRRPPKHAVTDNTQQLLDSMKNRLTVVNERLARIVPEVATKSDSSDSSSDDE